MRSPLGGVKRWFKYGFIRTLRSEQVFQELRDICASCHPPAVLPIVNYPRPGGVTIDGPSARQRADPVFVTGRFRCGSTAVWNAFRQVPGITAYYEPFNERRFFDPSRRGVGVDPSHVGVDDYAREYDGFADLTGLYDEDWTRRELYMDERSWNPAMTRFVEQLVERAPGRPVLQFNRLDFRLAWVRSQFPNATIVHLWRDPREQWCSVLSSGLSGSPLSASRPFVDRFYQEEWIADLRTTFPYLEAGAAAHPYRGFYLLWKTSWLFGQRFADVSIELERLLADPECVLGQLLDRLGMEAEAIRPMRATLKVPSPSRWTDYADISWFRAHEVACEALLDDYFGSSPRSRALPPDSES